MKTNIFKKSKIEGDYSSPKTKVIEVNIESLLCTSPGEGEETGTVVPGQEGGFDD